MQDEFASRLPPYVRHYKQAFDEITKVAGSVTPREVVETVLAMYLLAEEDLRRFRSDDAFRYQVARRVRALGDMSKGVWYDHRTRKTKLAYRDSAPKATEAFGGLVEKTLGMGGLYLARREQKLVEKQQAERSALVKALDAIE